MIPPTSHKVMYRRLVNLFASADTSDTFHLTAAPGKQLRPVMMKFQSNSNGCPQQYFDPNLHERQRLPITIKLQPPNNQLLSDAILCRINPIQSIIRF